jgi:hypothetical protein
MSLAKSDPEKREPRVAAVRTILADVISLGA